MADAVADSSGAAVADNPDLALRLTPTGLTRHRRPLKALTGIRFFAALHVVLFHSRLAAMFTERGHPALGNFFASGYLAVALFFILSGFILAYTYEGQIERRGDFRRFWEARFARIWPAYAVALVAISLPHLNFPTVSHMLACLFMVQSWDPLDINLSGEWNAVCWTLSAEAFFYLFFPWLQVALERLSTRVMGLALGGTLLFAIAINSAPRTFGYVATGIFRHVPLALAHSPEFIVGVILGNLFLRWVMARAARGQDTSLPLPGVLTFGSAAVTLGLLCTSTNRWTTIIVVAFAALVFGLAAERSWLSRFLSTPALILGGGISYSMYLMQLPVKFWISGIFSHFNARADVVARLGANLVLLLGISLILFFGVEDPARRLIRRGFAALQPRPEDVPRQMTQAR